MLCLEIKYDTISLAKNERRTPMNKIGIIGAMEEEVIALKRYMNVEEALTIAGMEFWVGSLKDKSIVIVRCGIGKVNAAICTQILIDKFSVEGIVNTGVAGGLYPGINIGDIIISSDTLQPDKEKEIFEEFKENTSHMYNTFFKANTHLIELAQSAAEKLKGNHKSYIGRVTSEEQFISSMRVKEEMSSTFTVYCAEMEGAAIAHTCYLNQVPFVIIRSISDKADQSTEINFEEFTHLVAKNTSKMIESIIEGI